MFMDVISTAEAARQKGVTRQAIVQAVDRGDIDGSRLSKRTMVIEVNRKFEDYKPNPVRQAAGLARRSSNG